ncbi:hypothetical protein [Rubritalea profundi]|uniref:Uncharacterized protein n=1 Tax=Rubritalea profundi TaxID=1658618 RepID=A0A2S7U2Y8_9BACT|nr:hypothetical protein [Rubritalea profundi]PQJ29355.1 hypothetical protein BSZ32_13245 [Rubritalea profundi]
MKPFSIFVVAFILQLISTFADDARPALEFLIIHDKKFKNSKSIEIKDLEIQGFVNSDVDFKIHELVGTKLETVEIDSRVYNKDGSLKNKSTYDAYQIIIELGDKAQASFASLTGKSVGKRVLIRIGEHPLLAPRVHIQINTPSFELTIRDEDKAKLIHKELSKLLKTVSTEQDAAPNH